MLLGYSKTSKVYKVYNYNTLIVEEAIHIRFNDKKSDSDILDLDKSFVDMDMGASDDLYTPKDDKKHDDIKWTNQHLMNNSSWKAQSEKTDTSYHPDKLIIGRPEDKISTSSSFREQSDMALISEIEPKMIEEALIDESWILAMQKELNQFQ